MTELSVQMAIMAIDIVSTKGKMFLVGFPQARDSR